MSSVLQFDDDASRRIEATYATPDLVQQRNVVRAALDLQAGEDVLDIGSGPALLAGEMAVEVGPGGSVHGIDPSESMLAIARRRELGASSAPVTLLAGDACTLAFADDSFDAAVATQVYEYVVDMPGALSEAHRVLRPGGRLLILDTDWDSIVWHSNDRERMQRVLAAWDEHLVDPYLPRRLTGLLEDAGFVVNRRMALPLLNAGYDENTYSAGLIGLIAAFVPGRHGLSKSDAAAWGEDLIALDSDYFFSLNRYLFVAVK
ncbi:MAG TPA: methyltransferase domain-containing protein [Solirubrobacteraceae bacterium]|nr:methyltransferase domain-containing protein [Solirubrobacteraceae bacterium]